MKRFLIFAGLMMVLLIGGGLTSQLVANQGSELLPILQTVGSPDGATNVVIPWKAEQFFLLIGFILFNLIGIAVTLAIIFWFLDRGVRRSRADANAAAGSEVAKAE